MIDFHRQCLNNHPDSQASPTALVQILRVVLMGGLILACLLSYAWVQTQILDVSYQLEQLKKENKKLKELEATLRLEYSVLTQPERVDREARRLGLIRSDQSEVWILSQERLSPESEETVLAESRELSATQGVLQE